MYWFYILFLFDLKEKKNHFNSCIIFVMCNFTQRLLKKKLFCVMSFVYVCVGQREKTNSSLTSSQYNIMRNT